MIVAAGNPSTGQPLPCAPQILSTHLKKAPDQNLKNHHIVCNLVSYQDIY